MSRVQWMRGGKPGFASHGCRFHFGVLYIAREKWIIVDDVGFDEGNFLLSEGWECRYEEFSGFEVFVNPK